MRRYWVIAPADSEQSDDWEKIWDFDLNHSLISIGWRDVRDVSKLELEAIKKRFRKDPKESEARFNRSRGASANMLWKFYNEIKPGHIVISRRGLKQIAAIGIVRGKPFHSPTTPAGWPEGVMYWLPNHLPVEWRKSSSKDFDERVFGLQTIQELSKQRFRLLVDTDRIKLPDAICLATDEADSSKYKPRDMDERKLVERQIRERRGQQGFRDALFARYGVRCLVTNCDVVAVLEAAHIRPYRGENDNHVTNGLVLRADLHTLFDLDLLGIDPVNLKVRLHPSLRTQYGEFEGRKLHCTEGVVPSSSQLKQRFRQFSERLKYAE